MPRALALRDLRKELEFVEERLAAHPDEYDTVRHMWKSRRDALQREIAETEVQFVGRAEVALLFNGPPVVGSQEIRLDFAAKALDSYQSLVASVASERAGSEPGKRGPLSQQFTSKLYVADMLRGSVGFLIEEPQLDQAELVPSPLKDAVDYTTKLLQDLTVISSESFDETLRALSLRTISEVKKMTKVLHDAGAEAKIVDDLTELKLDHAKTATLYDRLNQLEYVETSEIRDGSLLGVFPQRRQYEFQSAEDRSVFYGPVSEEFDTRYVADANYARSILLKPISATFRLTNVFRGRILQKQERTLLDVRPQVLQLPGDNETP